MTAEVRNEGHRQVIVLPPEIRFDTNEVSVERQASGQVVLGAPTLRRSAQEWTEFWGKIDEAQVPDDFFDSIRDTRPVEARNLFGE